MISRVPWVLEDGKCWAQVDERRRAVIAWDHEDRSLYLTVTVAAPANSGDGSQRVYSAPLCLLAASLLLGEPDQHRWLRALTEGALVSARDEGVLGALPVVVARSVEDWPATAVAAEAMKLAALEMPVVERLSLDLAAVGAWD